MKYYILIICCMFGIFNASFGIDPQPESEPIEAPKDPEHELDLDMIVPLQN